MSLRSETSTASLILAYLNPPLNSRGGESLAAALAEGKLWRASAHAHRLETLDPFDPVVQIEARQVRAEVGAEVLRHLELGRQRYAAGEREAARREFEAVLGLDEGNQVALGYLAATGLLNLQDNKWNG